MAGVRSTHSTGPNGSGSCMTGRNDTVEVAVDRDLMAHPALSAWSSLRSATVWAVSWSWELTSGPAELAAVVSAMLVAATLAVAAVAKLRDPAGTASDFETLGLVAPLLLARLVPLVELATAALLIFRPAAGGALAFALIIGFSWVLWRVAVGTPSGSPRPGCACFGGTGREPIGRVHLVRNLALLVLCGVAVVLAGS